MDSVDFIDLVDIFKVLSLCRVIVVTALRPVAQLTP